MSFLRESRYAGIRELTDSLSSLRSFSPWPSEPTELADLTRRGCGVV